MMSHTTHYCHGCQQNIVPTFLQNLPNCPLCRGDFVECVSGIDQNLWYLPSANRQTPANQAATSTCVPPNLYPTGRIHPQPIPQQELKVPHPHQLYTNSGIKQTNSTSTPLTPSTNAPINACLTGETSQRCVTSAQLTIPRLYPLILELSRDGDELYAEETLPSLAGLPYCSHLYKSLPITSEMRIMASRLGVSNSLIPTIHPTKNPATIATSTAPITNFTSTSSGTLGPHSNENNKPNDSTQNYAARTGSKDNEYEIGIENSRENEGFFNNLTAGLR